MTKNNHTKHSRFSVYINTRRILAVVWAVQLSILGLVILSEFRPISSMIRLPFVFVYLTFVPGVLLVPLLKVHRTSPEAVISYVVGVSLVTVMGIGSLSSVVYYAIGIERPLSPIPVMLTLLGVMTLLSLLFRRSVRIDRHVTLDHWFAPLPLALLCLPFISILGTYVYKSSGNNLPLIYLLLLISLLPLLSVVWNRESRWYSLAVWTTSLALLYHAGLWPFSGGHPGLVNTLEAGRWIPNSPGGFGSLLPNNVLFPVYTVLSDVTAEVQWSVVNPLFVSLLPVALYESYRRQMSGTRAVLAVSIFLFAYPFYTLYPGAGRVATPVLFLSLLAVAVTEDSISRMSRSILVLLFAAGLTVSHYGTAYVFLFALLGGLLVYLIVSRLGPKARDWVTDQIGNTNSVAEKSKLIQSDPARLLSPAFVGFYTALSVTWYLYTSQGVKFQQLPKAIVDAVYGVLYAETSGSAATAVTKDYASQIVATTRIFYILIGAFMGLGFLYVTFQYLFRHRTLVEEAYFALAAGHFLILGGSALPSGSGFAIARVMMIVFVFAAPFAVFGVDAIQSVFEGVLEKSGINGLPVRQFALSGFGIFLCLFLLFNSGVTAELLQQDFAPSKGISTERLVDSEDPYERARGTECRQCDIQTHIWLYTHANDSIQAYGDEYVESQTDFYSSEITDGIGYAPGPNYYKSIWTARNGTNGTAYMVLLPRNIDSGGVYSTRYTWHSMDGLNTVYENSNIVYRSKQTIIYLSGNETRSQRESIGGQ